MAERDTADLVVLQPSGWADYELIDSGEGGKLERFGKYVVERPEQDAIWSRSLPAEDWARADAVFGKVEGGEFGWTKRRDIPPRWKMHYADLTFWAELTPFRHTGVFPEQAPHWDWIRQLVRGAGRPVRVLNLFGYTGLAALAAAAAGADVTYVDASKPTINWARDNQVASSFDALPIRWLLDDAVKFVRREARRGVFYDGVIMDPPVFGRGPKGEIWRFYSSFPTLLEACREALSEHPLFVLVNAYAVDASAVMLRNVLNDTLAGFAGYTTVGELALTQKTPAPDGTIRLLPTGIFGRWTANDASGAQLTGASARGARPRPLPAPRPPQPRRSQQAQTEPRQIGARAPESRSTGLDLPGFGQATSTQEGSLFHGEARSADRPPRGAARPEQPEWTEQSGGSPRTRPAERGGPERPDRARQSARPNRAGRPERFAVSPRQVRFERNDRPASRGGVARFGRPSSEERDEPAERSGRSRPSSPQRAPGGRRYDPSRSDQHGPDESTGPGAGRPFGRPSRPGGPGRSDDRRPSGSGSRPTGFRPSGSRPGSSRAGDRGQGPRGRR